MNDVMGKFNNYITRLSPSTREWAARIMYAFRTRSKIKDAIPLDEFGCVYVLGVKYDTDGCSYPPQPLSKNNELRESEEDAPLSCPLTQVVTGGSNTNTNENNDEKGFTDVSNEPAFPIWTAALIDIHSRVWLPYREKMDPIDGLTTDAGWGCTIRSAQMVRCCCNMTYDVDDDADAEIVVLSNDDRRWCSDLSMDVFNNV